MSIKQILALLYAIQCCQIRQADPALRDFAARWQLVGEDVDLLLQRLFKAHAGMALHYDSALQGLKTWSKADLLAAYPNLSLSNRAQKPMLRGVPVGNQGAAAPFAKATFHNELTAICNSLQPAEDSQELIGSVDEFIPNYSEKKTDAP